MRIVHINVESPFMDNSGYQETILAECHKKMGNQVTIVNNNHVLHSNGQVERCKAKEYYNDAGVKIIRMNLYDKHDKKHIRIIRLYKILKNEKPDFIMVHEVFDFNVFAVVLYVKFDNSNCVIIADSHATHDNANIMNNNLKNLIFRGGLKIFNKYMQRYYRKVYGIVGDTTEILTKYAGISREKIDTLGLGYDESLIDFQHQDEIKNIIRKKYEVPAESVLIVHGGKLNRNKKTIELIRAANKSNVNVFLIIFGNFESEIYEKEVKNICDKVCNTVVFTGVLDQEDIYNMYLAADIAAFPGTASCLRQQAVATGVPLIIGYNDADEGVNLNVNGNAICLPKGWTENDLSEAIKEMSVNSIYRKKAQELSRGEYKKYSYQVQARMLIGANGKC